MANENEVKALSENIGTLIHSIKTARRESDTLAGALPDAFGKYAAYCRRWAKQLDGLIDEIEALKPARVCPTCDGDGCGKCQGCGFLTHYQAKIAESEVEA